MELTHIEHLGIAVKSIEACLPHYEGVLGLKCYNSSNIVVSGWEVSNTFTTNVDVYRRLPLSSR